MASPSRNGRRMVDRLDSPRSLSKTRDIGQKGVSPRPAKARKLALEPGALELQSQHPDSPKRVSQPQLPQNDSGLANPAGQKVRTYGKQRSHLKDMLSGLDSPPQLSSQSSLQQLVSKVDSMANTKDAFDVESEDDEPGTKLKSIHELRQAGLANRFHRDLGTLLEDIESTNKALRIQGLMQLVRKLQEQAFKRMLLESGELLRITSISRPDLDLTSTSVLLLGLWALAVSDTATAQALSQIYDGILHLPVQIIEETRSIFRIARDRKENLSKALVRDLCDFEGHVVDQSLSAGRQTSKNIIISRVALRSLEYVLKRLIELAEPVPEPPANLVEVVVHATRNHIQAMTGEEGGVEHLESIRLLMTWLEMTAATSKNAIKSMQATQIGAISHVLAEVMSWAKLRNSSIEQSCIRTAVEFSNGDAIVCEQFAESPLLQAIFAVVEEHFSHLRNGTEGTQTEETKLESVILALGCLLNLMDQSSNGRTRMLQLREGDVSQVDVLVNFFKQHVDETDEVCTRHTCRRNQH
jgi:Wings apart-like protein regulation of heterochromatin